MGLELLTVVACKILGVFKIDKQRLNLAKDIKNRIVLSRYLFDLSFDNRDYDSFSIYGIINNS